MLAFLWCVIQNLQQSLCSPSPSQGSVWLEQSQRGQGRWLALGGAAFLNALLPRGTKSAFKVLVPSNILCRGGEKIYSVNYSLTVW